MSDERIPEMIPLPPVRGPVSAQEYEVWQMVAEGYQGKEIAHHLGIARQTQEKHRANLYRKIGVNTALMASLQAVRHGVVLLPPRSSFAVSPASHFTNNATAMRNTAMARSGHAGLTIETTAKTPAVPTSR